MHNKADVCLTDTRSSLRRALLLTLEACIVVAVALTARMMFHNPTTHYDELFHVLAARSLLETGQPIIEGGTAPYDRSIAFTWMVAGAFKLMGESIFAARLPAMIAGALLVGVLYVWVRRHVGLLAAALAAALLAFCHEALNLSAFGRFYTLQALAILVASVCAYDLVMRLATPTLRAMRNAASIVLAVVMLLATWLALHLQATTIIAALNTALWGGSVLVWRLEHQRPLWRRGGWVTLIAALGLLAVMLAWTTGIMARMWYDYRLVALWAMDTRDDVGYYVRHLLQWYLPMAVLTPVLLVLAIRRRPMPVSFLLTVGGLGLVVHSFAGFKAQRYVHWTMPYLFALWGIGLAELILLCHRQALAWADRWIVGRDIRAWRGRIRGWVTAGVVVISTLGLAYGAHRTNAYYLSRRMLSGHVERNPFERPDWAAAAPLLQPIVDDVHTVIASATTKAVYYLGGADVVVSVTDRGRDHENVIDWRTGIRIITEPQTMEDVIEASPSGLIVIEDIHWRQRWFVPDDVADVIEDMTEPVTLPDETRLLAFRWEKKPATP